MDSSLNFALAQSTAPGPAARARKPNRHWRVAGAVLALHVAALWAMQNGLLQRAVQAAMPMETVVELIDAVQPATPKPRPTPQTPLSKASVATPTPVPLPVETSAITAPAPAAPAQPQAAVESESAPAKVELPISDADYLHNPPPSYPAMSRRQGEHGRVLVRVYVGTDGAPMKSELQKSSGFERLDRTALEAVLRWRFVPGKRGAMAQAMWALVPVNFVLE